MNTIKHAILPLFLFAALFQSFGDTGVPLSLMEELEQEKEIVRYFYGDLDLEYLPFGPLSGEIVSNLDDLDASIGVEALFLVELPEALAENPQRDLEIFNLLNRISSLKGIEYYSASRDRMRTLFADAYRVEKEGSKKPLEDRQFSSIPHNHTEIVFQEDLTFGKNYVATEYTYRDNRFLMQIQNLTTMWYYIFPLVRPDNFRMDLLIIPHEDKLIFYGASSVDSAKLFGIEKSKKDSFHNRIKAMHGWFVSLIEKEFSS